ncbi:MAG: SDR family oxidoreductase [Treponema sp.]|nr:SDR family oxidoreductase [Treponema sp.]
MIGIITGASSGIGLGIAKVLAAEGHVVYCISRSGAPKDKREEPDEHIIHIKGDICNSNDMKTLVDTIGKKQGIDFLINNAGITIKRRAEEITDEEFERVHRVNVFAPFRMSVLCYPYLKQSPHKGRIINISSMASHLGFELVVPYCSSKGAILSQTRGLAIEWANDNITVNSIAPGWFPSELSKSVMDDKRKAQILARMPLHAFGDTRDIGAMASFLLSDGAKYITGCDYAVDGGALAFGF